VVATFSLESAGRVQYAAIAEVAAQKSRPEKIPSGTVHPEISIAMQAAAVHANATATQLENR
jgi:hypothetical protein